MKKLLALVAVLAMALALCTACGDNNKAGGNADNNQQTSGDKTITIGIYEPASGENGPGGKQEVLGIRYAHSLQPTVEINGETYEVKLQEVDNQSDTTKAVSAAQNLVAANVSVVLGSYGSGVAIAGGPYFEQAQIPAIGISCTNPQVTDGNDYYFRVCFLDPFQSRSVTSLIQVTTFIGVPEEALRLFQLCGQIFTGGHLGFLGCFSCFVGG